MMAIDGAFACPECGAAVTAWRDDRQRGPVFDADPYEPYRPHVCRPSAVMPLNRIATALETAVAHMDGIWRERERRDGHDSPRPARRPSPAYLRPMPRETRPSGETPLIDTLRL